MNSRPLIFDLFCSLDVVNEALLLNNLTIIIMETQCAI